MKTRRIAAALLFAFLPSTITLPAIADDDPTTVQARARFKEGVDYFDKGKYEDARLAFLQAYSLKKHPAVLLNLAQSCAKSGHTLEAAKYFQQFLKEASTATPAQRKDAESGLAEVRQKLGRVEVVAPPGTDISVDDQGKVGTTPMDPIDVEVGQHTIKSPTQNVTVIAVSGQKVEARFGPKAVEPPPGLPPQGGANTPAETPPPAHDTVTADTGKHPGLFSPPDSMTPVYIGLIAAGIGAAGAVVFALFKSDAQSKADTVANTIRAEATKDGFATQGVCNNPSATNFTAACNTLRDNNNKVDTDATVANVSLVVMGVGLVVAGAWYLAGPKGGDSKPKSGRAPQRPILTPYAGAHNGGFALSGEF
jgi:hypothetical protein